ncbi:MAG TPA: L,D-transpeptidase, partial [Polyangiaceae bacterium]|nr:L,D-transpeptidase [Polyangiaceae bacterium]
WVCVDDEQATQDPSDPELLAIYPYRPRLDSAWPHNYAWAHAPVAKYQRAPQPAALDKLDPSRAEAPVPTFPALPQGLQESQTKIVGRSALSYAGEFTLGNDQYLLTGDLGWVPKERVELLPRSEFVGVELGEKLNLPLAFFRGKARPAFSRGPDGTFTAQPAAFARHAHVALSGETEQIGRVKYYKVKGQELWVSDQEAVIPTPKSVTPWGAPVGKPDTTGLARSGRATWIELSILEGWLVAFEGTTPRYATMISAGRGGTPVGDRDPLETASTPTGRFAIGGKFKTATMESSSSPIVHADVPWTQNFSGPHAIHSAYWHDEFGQLKSAGCVNVSPRDGKWLFEFTEPEVPEGWHGVRYIGRYGGGATLVILHE